MDIGEAETGWKEGGREGGRAGGREDVPMKPEERTVKGMWM